MTQTDTPTREPATDEVEPSRRRPRFELSAVQLVAGALAAMTAAVIGSRLGVSGTVVGAAVASLVAGLAGSLYTTSLQHGRQVISPLAAKAAPTLVMRTRSTAERTDAAAVAPGVPPGVPSEAILARGAVPARPATRRRAWRPVLVSAAAVFLLAGLGVTAVELATGQSLSGREGTTISQVGHGSAAAAPAQQPVDQPEAEEVTDEAGPAEGDPTPTPSPTPSDDPSETPSQTPSEDPSTTPSEDPSAPDEPSTTPEDPSTAPSETPTEPADTAETTPATEGQTPSS